MKLTEKNYKNYVPAEEQGLFKAILEDLEELNEGNDCKLYIDWQDWHNEYSPERTDPCPDFYGCYRLKSEEYPSECVGLEMTLDELDDAMLILIEYNVLKTRRNCNGN